METSVMGSDEAAAGAVTPYSRRTSASRRSRMPCASRVPRKYSQMLLPAVYAAPCKRRDSDPILICAGPSGLRITRSGPFGRTFRMSLHKEDMPCELSILLPSIVRPSASTGCSPCSISCRHDGRARLSALQHRADRRERLPHLGSGRRLCRDRAIIEAKENTLTIRGEKQVKDDEERGEVLYQGIAARAFERVFQLADYVQVKGASLENGLLHVDLVREIPEAKKPRQIPIGKANAQGGRGQGCVIRQSGTDWRERPGIRGAFQFGPTLLLQLDGSGCGGCASSWRRGRPGGLAHLGVFARVLRRIARRQDLPNDCRRGLRLDGGRRLGGSHFRPESRQRRRPGLRP